MVVTKRTRGGPKRCENAKTLSDAARVSLNTPTDPTNNNFWIYEGGVGGQGVESGAKNCKIQPFERTVNVPVVEY